MKLGTTGGFGAAESNAMTYIVSKDCAGCSVGENPGTRVGAGDQLKMRVGCEKQPDSVHNLNTGPTSPCFVYADFVSLQIICLPLVYLLKGK